MTADSRISEPTRRPTLPDRTLPTVPDRTSPLSDFTFPDRTLPTVPERTSPYPDRYAPLPERPSPVPERSFPPERVEPERTVPERTLPPVVRLPKVKLTLIEPPRTVDIGQDVDVLFQIQNIGDAPAVGVSLRVKLPFGLDHHDLQKDDIERTVDARIRSLAVNEKRQVRLTVQPTRGGRHFGTAELRLQDSQLDLREFQVNARQPVEDRPPAPRPDFP